MSQEKETKARDTINALKEEMTNLSKLVERGAGLSLNQENLVKELKQAKDELQRQVDEQSAQLTMMDKQLEEQHKLQQELRQEKDEGIKSNSELRDRLGVKENENVREIRRREKTQKELQDARLRLDESIKQEEQLKEANVKAKAQGTELERHLSDARGTMEKYLKDYDNLFAKTQKVTEDLESQVERNKKMHSDMVAMEKDIKLKNTEIGRLNTEKSILERKVDKEHRAAMNYQQIAEESKTPLLVAQAEIDSLKKELQDAHRNMLQLTKQTEKVAKEKESTEKAKDRTEIKLSEQLGILNEKERVVASLGQESDEFRAEIQRLRSVIFQLEKDREHMSNEVGIQRGNVVSVQEELKLRDVQITELNRRIAEWESRLRQQQQLYESVRGDRNKYSKGLIEAQDDIAELRKKSKIMSHQIDQLKEEVATKDQAIVNEHFEFQKADKIRENKETELCKKNLLIIKNQELINQQDDELKKLVTALKRMDEDALAQRKEYDQVINERDILGMQLIRRNDELALLYEKLRVMHSALRTGEAEFAARLDDIRLMKVKIKDLARENLLTKGSGAQIEDLRRDVLHLHRELLQEKTKVTALSEELENPMNVHRWRKLEGSDPATFELIQKIQTLQRRLISKTEEVVEKGLVIQEKDKLYAELKDILARQPGPEVAEQLNVYQSNLKQKSRQMKAMASEVNMYQAQVNEYKYELERVSRELLETKRKYYQQKRKDQMVQELEMDASGGKVALSKTAPVMLQNQQTAVAKGARVRFTGGGFAIK